ncbi:DUF937 domain-containing protein [Aliihoeflea aestuarii]|jgi:hypothetical protein|uniref:DUF937 domain-containing protein n=1 Tax=Aliihoeflea aestuarii TaxID=453840 RepID=UPI00209236E7|nr:DUF937 domain-containing protein [Aliihoeflea aestuarii]MCO6389728.1 DUF937 domain-containing protein [Aliihoeflea aestuarii]
MLPLYDMMMKVQNGRVAELLARQVNLTRQQGELALEALLPAFSEALKRNTADPFGFSQFMGAMGGGQYAKYFEDAARAFTPEGVAAGNDVLGQLFGSKELSRAVAAQAAQATGIAQEAYRQIMPSLAAMMMGGFFKQATGQMPGAGSNPFLDAFQKMAPQADNGANPFDAYARMMQDMFAPKAQEKPKAVPDPFAGNPFMKMFEDMMQMTPPARPDEPTAKQEPTPFPFENFFGEMFETGRKQQEDYQKTMTKLVDDFFANARPRQ